MMLGTFVIPPAREWTFNIDRFLDPFVPPSPVPLLPVFVSHFLGHRNAPLKPIGNLIVAAWAFVGVFVGVALVQVVGSRIPAFRAEDGSPMTVVSSLGAAAVLEYYAIESPLAQPRNAVISQLLASIVGVSVTKLFALGGPDTFESLRWLGGTVSCASIVALMALTGTVHPPAGATALAAVTDSAVSRLGWRLLPYMLLCSVLMQCVALLVNNVQRKFPSYWWTPEEVGQFWTRLHKQDSHTHEGAVFRTESHATASSAHESKADERPENSQNSSSSFEDVDMAASEFTQTPRVVITPGHVMVPEDMFLRPEEKFLLENLSQRL